MCVQSLQGSPTLARFTEQLLYGFIQILFSGKARIMRSDRPDQPRQRRLFTRLCIFDPVQQGFCRFGGLLVLCGRVANHQHIRLHLLAIMLQQPDIFCLRQRRQFDIGRGRNINDIDIFQHAIFSREDQFTGQKRQDVDGNTDGIQHLAVVERMQHRLLRFRRRELTARQESFARQAKIINQKT
ncbi:hypothetical protein D3C78_1378600 [compost metagenome]